MKRNAMLVFFLIVLTIYFFANFYLYRKGYSSIPVLKEKRWLYTAIFFSLAAIFIVAKVIESRHSSVITDILNVAGGFWLSFMLYGIMFFLVSDIVYLLLRLFRLITPENIMVYRKWAFAATLSLSAIFIIGGFINAIIPVVTRYNITINKNAGDVKSLRIAAVSDIHLGSVIRKRSMNKLSSMLKDLKPDLVLLLGDIVDGEIGPVMRGDLLQYFHCPDSKYGMLGITGNHEFIGGASQTIPYIESKGIRLLKDEIHVIDGSIQLVGRKDRDSDRFYGGKRLTLAELLAKADSTKPVILLDHQPFGYDEAVKHGVDLELSGHTHNGQMWPLNHITEMIYELSYGYLRKGNTHFIVSSGYGLWGPRVRSASRSEVLLVDVTFNGSSSD